LSKNKYFIDLFAGCGGLSLGLEKAGFTPLFVNELNKDALNTYLQNRIDEYSWLKENNSLDIKDLVLKEGFFEDLRARLLKEFSIGDIDLVAGGPPCQGFSGIGHRRSYSVEKKQLPSNHLYEDMVFAIHSLKPKIFLFENVKGLLSAKWTKSGNKGEIWKDVIEKFKSLDDYTLGWHLVHAKEYGVPQNRPRILLVGIRRDNIPKTTLSNRANGFLPDPTFGYPNLEEVLSDLVDPNYKKELVTTKYPSAAKTKWQKYYRLSPKNSKVFPKGSEVTEQEYSNHSSKVEQKFQYMIENNGEIPESMQTKKFFQKVLPKKWGESGPTITATSMPDDYVHFIQPRVLTVREWARLQTFPDYYTFAGKRTTGGIRRAGNPRNGVHEREVPKYTQIGNAVPVKMAYEVGLHFIKILNNSSFS